MFYARRRCSYLAITTPLVRELLVQRNLPFIGEDSDIWYSCNNVPLRWITVHTQNYPKDSLKMAVPSIKTMQDMYMALIKESDFLRHGSSKKVMRLPKQEQTALWESIADGNYEHFWNVNEQLVTVTNVSTTSVTTTSEQETVASTSTNTTESATTTTTTTVAGTIKYIPLRIYLPECPVIQEPILAINTDGKEQTLGDALHELLPQLFSKTTIEDNANQGGETISSVITASLPSLYPVLHGIELPLDMSLLWAAQHLVYADNFLHVVIHIPKA
ncbi:autophagy-related protein 5 [Syncephalis plumigaleata]|nr:autophagy-related protein 5 [Syncephalis plumigaleata]